MKRLYLAAILFAVCSMAWGQFSWEKPVTISVKQEPLHIALKTIFDQTGFPYEIQAGIAGRVTLARDKVPFNVVLREILMPLDLVWECINDVWVIRRERRIQKSTDTNLVHPSSRRPHDVVLGEFTYDQVDIQLALKEIFRSAGLTYTVDPKLNGLVTIGLRNISFDRALSLVLRQAEGAYRIETDGKYEIFCVRRRNE